MAYPFTPMPSLGEFIVTVTSDTYGAQVETISMSGPRGDVEIKILVRRGKRGKPKIAVIPDIKDSDVLTNKD